MTADKNLDLPEVGAEVKILSGSWRGHTGTVRFIDSEYPVTVILVGISDHGAARWFAPSEIRIIPKEPQE